MSLKATVGDDGMIYILETDQPGVVAVTTPAKWEAFVKGVKAGEFDHFVAGVEQEAGSGYATTRGGSRDDHTP